MSAHRLPADTALAGWVIDQPLTATALGISKVSEHKLVIGTTAETNTVADPIRAGLLKIVTVMSVGSGGSRAITFATAIDQAGTTVITFTAARQTVLLYSVPDGSTTTGYRWQRFFLDGTATPANSVGSENFADGAKLNTTAGNGATLAGNNNQKVGLWGATPVVQPASTGELIGILGNAATNINATNMNSNGNTGNAAYSFNDVVKALKQMGALAK